jgi:hypothetical protein
MQCEKTEKSNDKSLNIIIPERFVYFLVRKETDAIYFDKTISVLNETLSFSSLSKILYIYS